MFSSNATQVSDAAFIEDVFSTFLYTGNGSTQTINNGIDLAGKGGLVWIKQRQSLGTTSHFLMDSARGSNFYINSNQTFGQDTLSIFGSSCSFNSSGFSLTSNISPLNESPNTYASWTFREQPRFFDIVTFTTPAAFSQNFTVNHSLGSVPGCIIYKKTSGTSDWSVYHRGLTNWAHYLYLNATMAQNDGVVGIDPTSTTFTVNTTWNIEPSSTYVAYLFAHNAGGFGATGADNVISCGSYTGNGSTTGPVVTLGYEPQWILIKNATGLGDWNLIDNMRGFDIGGRDAELNPNLPASELPGIFVNPTATGFQLTTTDTSYNSSGQDYIYIAIRRGPMRTPTSGTSVFAAQTRSGNSTPTNITNVGFSPDLLIGLERNFFAGTNATLYDRLRNNRALESTANNEAEKTSTNGVLGWDIQNGIRLGTDASRSNINATGANYGYQFFRRAPSFFDLVCFSSNSLAGATFSHNLGVVPELLIVKSRGTPGDWYVYGLAVGGYSAGQWYMKLNLVDALTSYTALTTNTASSVTISNGSLNDTNATQVAYLFASCPGVSKVGSYTATGSTQIINCGFAAGARFVLIKRTDAAGGWYVWDSARGIVAGNDPYLLLNSTAAEVTDTDWVDTAASGFELSNASGNEVNINGATYIFLAIA